MMGLGWTNFWKCLRENYTTPKPEPVRACIVLEPPLPRNWILRDILFELNRLSLIEKEHGEMAEALAEVAPHRLPARLQETPQ